MFSRVRLVSRVSKTSYSYACIWCKYILHHITYVKITKKCLCSCLPCSKTLNTWSLLRCHFEALSECRDLQRPGALGAPLRKFIKQSIQQVGERHRSSGFFGYQRVYIKREPKKPLLIGKFSQMMLNHWCWLTHPILPYILGFVLLLSSSQPGLLGGALRTKDD